MGLDTVELVVSIEKHFRLKIPAIVCEQLGTVGDVAKWLEQQLETENQRHSIVRENVALQLQQLFSPLLIGEETQLVKLIKDQESQLQYRKLFEEACGLIMVALDLPKAEPSSS